MTRISTPLLLGPLLWAALAMALPALARANQAQTGDSVQRAQEQAAPPPMRAASSAEPPSHIAQNKGITEGEAPYVTSPDYVVDAMLDLGQVGPGDYIIDLGSGDGRIAIAAAHRGAFGLGVDIDPELVRESRKRAAEDGVQDRVMFVQQDLFETDISQASVVTMYLLQSLNLELRPLLLEELRPGTRVVSHNYHMGEWKPDDEVKFGNTEAMPWSVVYAWVIPADVAGAWQWEVDGERFNWRVKQQFQELDTQLEREGMNLEPENVELHGRRIGFTVDHDGTHYVFSGRAEGNRIEGIVKMRSGNRRRVHEWAAKRH